MATAVIMPRQGQSVESCILVEWLVAKGDGVKAGAPLANIETDKAVFEVESPADGTVLELFFAEGDDIPVLTTIAAIGEPGEDIADIAPGGTAATSAPSVVETPGAMPAVSSATDTVPTAAAAATATARGVSPRARKRAAALGVTTASLSGSGPAGRVLERDVEAAAAGARLSPVARAAVSGGGGAAPSAGSGPGGMVLAADLCSPGPTAIPETPAVPTVTPLTGIRKLIAERMHQSLATTAQLTLNMSFDATAVLDYRRQLKARGAALGLPNITLNDMIAFVTARTLLLHPDLNAHFPGDRVVRHPAVHLGVATDTPRGLMVPVLQNASGMALAEISRQLKPLIEAAQAGKINPDLLQGGTFTITNMGMLGIESFTPILNAPEVAILGVGGLTLRPVMRDGEVVHVQSITLSLTINHQVVDGAPGARFLKDLVASLEGFALTLTA